MNQSLPKIFVIVLNFNGGDVLLKCLNSVFQSDYSNFEVVVVDNASHDGSFEKARLSFSNAHFIKNFTNIGFSRGNNVGIRYALEKFADHILVLNNDAFLEKSTLSDLIKSIANISQVGIISPLILNSSNNQIWFAGGKINWAKMRSDHITQPISSRPYLTEYVTGCAMLIKKDVFKKIGLFDERFFLYYEDADFSLRAKKANFKCFVVPAVKVKHLEQSNTENKNKQYWLVLSGLLFFHLHATFIQKMWLTQYLMLRKIKNSFDLFFSPTPLAQQINKAYQDYKKIPK